MTVELLNEGTRKTRKTHQCYHCYRLIAKGTKAKFSTCKLDYLYTLYFHPDCAACWDEYASEARLSIYDYPDGGYPPLLDGWWGSGELEALCRAYRGKYPHVITRLEFHEQKNDFRLGEEVYA